MFHGGLSIGRLIWAALTTDEANLVDLILFGRGNRFSLTRLHDEELRLKLSDHYLVFKVPIFFLLGHYDQHVPAVFARVLIDEVLPLAQAGTYTPPDRDINYPYLPACQRTKLNEIE